MLNTIQILQRLYNFIFTPVDDNNQYIISYFGRSQFESNSIEWLRPHEICQRNGLPRPKMFVRDADRFDINQGEIGNCWFLGKT